MGENGWRKRLIDGRDWVEGEVEGEVECMGRK